MRNTSLVLFFSVALWGCSLWRDPHLESVFEYRESALATEDLAVRIAESDAFYLSPRTPERVLRSLEAALSAISARNNYTALWRGARACAWLASHHPVPAAREEHAALGVRIGRAAVAVAPQRVECHYYAALNLGGLSQLDRRGLKRVAQMAQLAHRVIEIDESFEYAGGHRFVGILYNETKDYPLVAIGTIDDALYHLRRACELFPEYGHNQLALAEVLIEDELNEDAIRCLERVLSSPAPADRDDDHAEWVARSRVLLRTLQQDL